VSSLSGRGEDRQSDAPTSAARLPAAASEVPRRGPMANIAAPTEKAVHFRSSLGRLVARLRPDRVGLILVIALATASVTLTVIGPRLLGHATDIIFRGVIGGRLPAGSTAEQAVAQLRGRGEDRLADVVSGMDVVPGRGIQFDDLRNVLLLALTLYVVAALLAVLQGQLLNRIVNRAVRRLRSDVESKLHRLPLSYFDRQPRGEILSRATNDIDNIQQGMQQTLSQLLLSTLTVIGVVVMMVSISPLLASIALVTIPLVVLVTRQIAKRSKRKFIAQWSHTGHLNGQIEEAFSGHALVKVFGRQREVQATFDTENEKLYRASFGAQFISGLILPVTMFIGNLNYVAIAVVGGLRVASGAMTLGDVQAFVQYSRQFTQPLTQVASIMNVLQSGVASAERVFELLDTAEERADPDPASTLDEVRGHVEFDDVSFRYVADRPLIEHLSLDVEPGRTVAIVGPTGAGKTTLVNLIMRFYDLDGGAIRVDGVDIETMRRRDVRGEIGMVLQDAWLFGGTIRDNIAYGGHGATEEEIREAARISYVDRFVHSLPDGYDTVVDDQGSNLSAGERQLVTIARAFLADPAILILDEATSSVDTRTEVLVQRAMAALRADRTSFVIAHRLSTIRDADTILVMEDGSIVEQGNHDELLAQGGPYFRLYNAQFTAAMVDEDELATRGVLVAGD
jgi:ATP-binding cassette subfamily B multidrug efflux pump